MIKYKDKIENITDKELEILNVDDFTEKVIREIWLQVILI